MSSEPVRVALLGGSFNPPHVGHLIAAQYVKATQEIDEVWLLPSFRHPFGKQLTPFEHRARMCRAMCADASGWLQVCEVEQQLGGDGRTVNTLKHLRGNFPDHRFSLVIGSDIVKDLPHWKDFDEIERLARVIVLHRPGHQSPKAIGPPLAAVSSTEVRELLERGQLPGELVPRAVLDYAQDHHLYGL
jgi:nicotinate-nucleotide adenylyltransferase